MAIRSWLDESTTEETNDFLLELSRLHLNRVKSSLYAGCVATLIEQRDFRGLGGLNLEYSQLSASDAYELRQIRGFFEKREDLELGIDKEEVAWTSFEKAEDLCRETNTILRAVRSGSVSMEPDFDAVMFTARRKIARVLGDVPRLSELKPRFGPGASTKVTKRMASWKRKLSEVPACSEDLLPLARLCLEEMQGWFLQDLPEGADSALVTLEIHRGKLAFVPKSYKTYRSIVVEPQLNSMFQLGIGDFIARKLRKVGLDIRDQSLNKGLAQLGSLTGGLATLDLSSASDTIALELVAELLPIDWFSFLRYFRTSTVTYRGREIRLEKFSSMGNGFTFPLETLIFWALARASVDLNPKGGESATVAVYGDDIVVPSTCYEGVSRVLRYAGFIVNNEKSYSTGPFRESCGGDYLLGTDIRPFYQRGPLSGQTLFNLHNFYVRRFDEEAASLVAKAIPEHIKLWGPDGYGDGHLIKVNHPLKPHARNRGWGGYTFETYTLKPRSDYEVTAGDKVLPIYSTYIKSPLWDAYGVTDEILSSVEEDSRHYTFGRTLLKELRSMSSPTLAAAFDHAMEIDRISAVTRHGRDGTPVGSLPGGFKVNRVKVYVLA